MRLGRVLVVTGGINGDHQDFYPDALSTEIDELNDLIYNNINNFISTIGKYSRSNKNRRNKS